MLLAIDAGNTNTVFALLDEGKILHKWRISTEEGRTAEEYMVWVSALMDLAGIVRGAVDGAIIATVVPPTRFQLELLCRRHFRCEPMIIGEPNVSLGIEVMLPNPSEVGADRLVNAVAASDKFPGKLIVIDFGTATTFDVVGKDGDYLGGVICPGINLSLKALHLAAAKLPHIAVEEPTVGRVTGHTTYEAMQSGIFWGYVGMIDGLVDRLRSEHDGKMTVIATGGLAKIFFGQTKSIEHVDHDLTINGLNIIYQRNRSSRTAERQAGD